MHGLVVIGNLVVKVGAVAEHSDAYGLSPLNPLVNGSGAVVEIPGDHETDGIRAQGVKTIENDAGLDAGHDGAGHAEFGESYAT